MLIDDLKLQLKNTEQDIEIIKEYWKNSNFQQDLDNLNKTANNEDFWKNPDQATTLKKLQQLKLKAEKYNFIINTYNDTKDLLDLFAQDEAELSKIGIEIKNLINKIQSFKVELLLSAPEDSSNCFLTINSGAGGTESQDWAEILLRMYIRFCEREHFSYQILDYQSGEGAGIKSGTIFIKGENAYGLLKNEHGVHRLVRISPYDANKRRHTSFASVFLAP